MRRGIVRQLYGLLLCPLPETDTSGKKLGYARDSKLRVTTTLIALKMLSDTPLRDTAIITLRHLCVEAGWAEATAFKNLATLRELGLITKSLPGTNKAGARWTPRDSRYAIRKLTIDRRDETRQYAESIESLVSGSPDTLAKVILSAAHPAWGHSSTLNYGHWLLLLADVTGMNPAAFKLSWKSVHNRRPTLQQEHLIPETVDQYLTGILDRIAANPAHGKQSRDGTQLTADYRKAVVTEQWVDRSTERAQDLKNGRDGWDYAGRILETVIAQMATTPNESRPIPTAPWEITNDAQLAATHKEIGLWGDEFRKAFKELHRIDGQLLDLLKKRLTHMLTAAGYDSKRAADWSEIFLEASY
ncbi:hypothetical protein BWO91_17685 [Plantibacter flavus]|nr:hypothetical protein BWO91_17685 [Plantibacter flavus]